jgi:phosphomevalonate kinase
MAPLCVSAPGKMMLAGEYVVLDGAVALVCAVDRRAIACLGAAANRSHPGGGGSPETRPLPPEALLARSLAESRVGKTLQELHIDVTALRAGERKLGLGSSAAGAAAAAAAIYAHAGHDITAEAVRRQVLEVALEGHRSVAPEGSGADVAASVLGGFVRFRKTSSDAVEADAVAWPEGLHACVVWTGAEARTSDLVRRVRELEARDPATYGARMDALRAAAEDFVTSFGAGDTTGVVRATGEHHRAMASLGDAAGAPIVEDRLAAVASLAEATGGAAKPSGAGGGDVALAFFGDARAASHFRQACGARHLDVLPLSLGDEGVSPCTGDIPSS